MLMLLLVMFCFLSAIAVESAVADVTGTVGVP
jgi:hypothetical protein